MAAIDDSFVVVGEESVDSAPASGSFDAGNAYFSGTESVENLADDAFTSQPSIDAENSDGKGLDGEFSGSDGPILPPPSDMEPEEGYALREWRRQNAIRLEEKEKREKELLTQIVEEAEQFKAEFHKKREATSENNRANNREKEKLFLASQEKFYAEAHTNYWKAIAELIPKEVPAIEKRRGKKDQEKKPAVAVLQGPKPGKPTDLSRMRQILVKLKYNVPPHLKTSQPPPASANEKETASKDVTVTTTAETVVAAA